MIKNYQKIKIIGSGGQGVKFLSQMLGEILIAEGYEVSLIFDYDAAVRGGDISAELTFSKSKIANPFSSEIDFLIMLRNTKLYPPCPLRRIEASREAGETTKTKIFDFSDKKLDQIAIDKFNDKRLFNMIILGAILKMLNFNIKTIKIDKKFREAAKYGYQII